MGNESSTDSSDEGIMVITSESYGKGVSPEYMRVSRRPRERLKISVDMSALEEGMLDLKALQASKSEDVNNTMATKPIFIPRCQVDLTDISTLVKKNSFTALNEKDAQSLVLENEILDRVGDFPYLCDVSDVSAFEELFRFVAEYDFQLVSVDREETAIVSIFVIRPVPLGHT